MTMVDTASTIDTTSLVDANFSDAIALDTSSVDAATESIVLSGEYDIDLTNWKLTLPTDEYGDEYGEGDPDGDADEIQDYELSEWAETGNENFTVNDDGSITFTTQAEEGSTTETSTYRRSELREMIRGGNDDISTTGTENNWALDTSQSEVIDSYGGINGTMSATLQVDQVTTEGESLEQVGRVIIGQIHGSDDEPLRLYYHKQADSDTGAIYFAHEPTDDSAAAEAAGDENAESWHAIIGSDDEEELRNGEDNGEGIPLGEVFSYDISMDGSELSVTITREDGSTYTNSVDVTDSGFDAEDEYLYFKAGVYEGNNTTEDTYNDYSSATFYDITVDHEGNYGSEDTDDE